MRRFKSFSEFANAFSPAPAPKATPLSQYSISEIKKFFSEIESQEVDLGYYARCSHCDEYSDGTLVFHAHLYKPVPNNLPVYWPDGPHACGIYSHDKGLSLSIYPRDTIERWIDLWKEEGVEFVRTFDKMSQEF